jgi:hypothetical protein
VVLEDAEEWCVEEEAIVRKLRGYMADDLETKGVQKGQGQEHNIGLQFGKMFQARKAGEDVRQASGSCCTKKNSVEGHQIDMCVNKSNGGDKKHQYFGQFRGKELKKVDSNTEK